MEAETIVKQIQYNENLIQDVQCTFRWFETQTDQTLKECQWGYKNPKEFISGTRYGTTEDGTIEPFTEIIAFDGKVTRDYRYVPSSEDKTGGIYAYNPYVFNVDPSPKTLLGYTISQDGNYTLSALLSNKYVKEKNVQAETFQGRECIILQAMGFRTNRDIYDVRIWIDPKRNYRPLKMEVYHSPEDKGTVAGLKEKRWKYISHRIHNIVLNQFDGIWFPVTGELVVYGNQPEALLKGKTDEEVRKRYPGGMSNEEIMKRENFVTFPKHPRQRIDLSEIRINSNIDPVKFSIDFPQGCLVWDNRVGYSYKIPAQ